MTVKPDARRFNRLTTAIEAVMSDSRAASRPLALLLAGLAGMYGTAMQSRARLFQRRRLKSYRLPCKVVSVGNITLGGTGKTPMSIYAARMFHETGRRVAVVSRGYKGMAEKQGGIVSDGRTLRMSARIAGDEPYLMARHLLPLGVPVLVGQDRVRSGWQAAKRFGTEILVLDDGFQHLRLHRDLDIVLLDARRPFGNGYSLPRGTLREPLSALSRADVCLLTRCPPKIVEGALPRPTDQTDKPPLNLLERRVFPAAHNPFLAGLFSSGWSGRDMAGELVEEVPAAPVFAFAGLARNDSFFDTLQEMGFDLRGWTTFADHHVYKGDDITALEAKAVRRGAEMMVTTEKDLVKIDATWLGRLPLLAVGVHMDLGGYAEAFRRFVCQKLCL